MTGNSKHIASRESITETRVRVDEPESDAAVRGSISNLFENLPTGLSEELIEVLAESKHLRVERIVSTGHHSHEDFWYDQDLDEWVVVLKGEARLLFEDEVEPIGLKPGDYINIPAHKRHRVEWTTPTESTVWLAVFYKD